MSTNGELLLFSHIKFNIIIVYSTFSTLKYLKYACYLLIVPHLSLIGMYECTSVNITTKLEMKFNVSN